MDKIKRFIECVIPVTACNIKCGYCYVVQEDKRTNKLPEMKYSAEYIQKALSIKRMGGVCYINICGSGETLLPKETIDIVKRLLEEGHYINITTNGTLTKRFDEIIKLPKNLLERLHFAFSFHYLELKKINKVEEFFKNIKNVKDAGCSFVVQFNLCDEYLPYIEEVKELCRREVGAFPQVAATRNEKTEKITLLTEKSIEEYNNIGNTFNSPLFRFTMDNFMVKRKEFCYAGDWSFILDLSTGDMKQCYFSSKSQNIFKNIEKPIKFKAIGNNCGNPYCVNSSHFMSLGIIPSLQTPEYSKLRNREEASWYNDKMNNFLSQKLIDNNKEYTTIRKLNTNFTNFTIRAVNKVNTELKKAIGIK